VSRNQDVETETTSLIVACCVVIAVEKVTVLSRLLSAESIENNQQIKNSLAHSACYLIGSLQDINLYVVERTALYLETIKASSIKVCYLSVFLFSAHIYVYCVGNDDFGQFLVC